MTRVTVETLGELTRIMTEVQQGWSRMPPNLSGESTKVFQAANRQVEELGAALTALRTEGVKTMTEELRRAAAELVSTLTRINELLNDSRTTPGKGDGPTGGTRVFRNPFRRRS